ncbi:MAG: hypothetical protein CMP59_12405 [Flavobacteriales bacterium]|nr:hypothetical protein [Flavobacteriales bacterium]
MNKERLTILIIASSLSILALIALQLYWIKISVKSQQEQFDQRVMNVMQEVVKKLEKEEAITKVTSELLTDQGLDSFGEDSLISMGTFPSNNFVSANPKRDDESYASIQGDRFKLNIELPNPRQDDSSTFIMRETQKRVINSKVPNVGRGDTVMQNQIRRKAYLINEIVNELAFIRISNNFNERIDSSKIDSLFGQELLKAGISTPYIFDILDAETNRLSFHHRRSDADEIAKSEFQLELFPNDYFIQSDTILLFFPKRQSFIWLSSWKVLIVSILIVLILSSVFYSSLSTIFKQKRLSQVKNDFINNMTHELKTPISTIGLACEALIDEQLDLGKDKRNQYVGMINDENRRLSLLVDNVLKSAVWDSTEMKLNLKAVDLHPLIEKVVKSFRIQVEKRGGTLDMDLKAERDIAVVDPVHFSNIIFNLLDNANKYSNERIEIKVSSKNTPEGFELIIKDRGIGISKDDQKRIFDKFYRVSTGNIHEVKGFGLGLSYVKRMMDHFDGEVELKSKQGEGTEISLRFKKTTP